MGRPSRLDAYDCHLSSSNAVETSGDVLWEINLGMTPELRPNFGSNLFVFALPERD